MISVWGTGSTSRGRDVGPAAPDDHRVFGLRNDSVLQIQKGWIGHHRPRPEERIQEGRGPRFETEGPALGERERLELFRQKGEKVVQFRLFHRLCADDSVNVPGPAAVHLARAGRGERLDGHYLAFLQHVMAVRNVRHALARVEEVPPDRVTGEVPNRTRSMGLDRSLNALADGAGSD